MLNSNIRLTKFWTFLLISWSRTLTLKSPARKSILLALVFSERIFLRKAPVICRSPSGGLYTTSRIMFLERLLIISIHRDSISSQFILRSSQILCRSESRINIAIPPPLLFFLIWCNLLVEIRSFFWDCYHQPMSQKDKLC